MVGGCHFRPQKKALLVTCFDPRYQPGITAHFEEKYRLTTMSVAGGPIRLVEEKRNNRWYLYLDIKEVAIEELGVEVIILAGHKDCKYIQKYNKLDSKEADQASINLVREAGQIINNLKKEMSIVIEIITYMCRFDEDILVPELIT